MQRHPSPLVQAMMSPTIIITRAVFMLVAVKVLSSFSFAQDTKGGARPDGVPVDPTLEDFQDLLSNSPFRRLMSLSDDLLLTGVAKLRQGLVVTVQNRRTNETITVSKEPNPQGWRLVGVTSGAEISDIQATIQVGKQEITLRFDKERSSPERIRYSRRRTFRPASEPEKPSVEQWLARLEPDLLGNLDELIEPKKEQFRYDFKAYLEMYPDSSSELRADFAKKRLSELVKENEQERQVQGKQVEDLTSSEP